MISALLASPHAIVMGVLNATPDSFSDGGRYNTLEAAMLQALEMQNQGAKIIDIGGESTRPNAEPVALEQELQRVIPVIKALREVSDICISIDTSKPQVMLAAVEAGANLVNDVNALAAPSALKICAQLEVPVCIMHMQGQPTTMQGSPTYSNVVDDIKAFLSQRIEACLDAGIKQQNIIIDPGFGFGKTQQHNFQLLKRLNEFNDMGLPLLVGLSRKSMLAGILGGVAPGQRLYASIAALVLARMNGANIFRVHDVKPSLDALKVCEAITTV